MHKTSYTESRTLRAARILAVCLCFMILLAAIGCATRPAAITPDDLLFGTWVNERYDTPGSPFFAKRLLFADGRELDYDFLSDAEPSRECRNTIQKAWTDTEGSHWYRIHTIGWQYANPELKMERFALVNINAEGSILEQLNAKFDYPEELDPTDVNYVIYYRHQE